ncbi:phage tail spike protein [Alkalicoccobacillus gibsonii]|uniref:phage tail spike protein n=1 Tax=Alkalicoccobacillus gibsonii TaxID=79881 RepID=UPI0019314BE6|nr:phage tail spike protein [Alkalicoccobacillus gibsonii]MBM0064787.1 phage tail protein [Alkalicoccobacillus gibsonii]
MYKVDLINNGKATTIHHHEFNDLKLIRGDIKQTIGLSYSFTFDILPNNPGYNLIKPLETLVVVENTKTEKIEFDGVVLMPTEAMDDSGKFGKSFLCASELVYLNHSAQRHGEYRNITIRQFLQAIVDRHNREVTESKIDKKFVLGKVDVVNNTDNVYRYLGYESTLDSINDKLVNRLGGELWVRKENGVRYLDYLVKGGQVSKTKIELQHNLKSITKEADPSEIITRLIPLGASIESEEEGAVDASQARITIESVNAGKDYIDDLEAQKIFGLIAKSQTWDDITIPSNLLTRGRQFLNENNRVKVKHEINALDLSLIGLDTDSFDLGNSYPVINPVMAINETLRVVEKNIDINNPANNSLVVGDLFKKASQYQNEANKSLRNIGEIQNTVGRQSRSIGVLKNDFEAVNRAVGEIKVVIDNSDIPGIEQAVLNLNLALRDLEDTITELPVYEPATQLKDGLFSFIDKTKLDGLQNYEPATETVDGLFSASDKSKLNKITATQVVDLDNVLTRLARLEGGVNG